MKRLPLPYLLLLPLLAVLLFGNCGGGVNHFLFRLQQQGRLARLDSLTRQRQQLRSEAQKNLHGRARRDQLMLIEQRTDEQVQPLLQDDWQRKKFLNRRIKIERRLRKNPVPEKTLFMLH